MYSVIIENFHWMTFNILLALLAVLLSWLFYKAKKGIIKIIFLITWLIFVPNTIYIFTDILHLMRQVNKMNLFGAIILFTQYAALFITGFLTYILSLYLIEKKLKHLRFLIIGINFLIGIGILLGRIHRLNSWDIILNMEKVGNATIEIISSPKLISLSILFGLLGNFIYFLFKKKTIKYLSKIKKKI